jgi:hypothetical protein
MWQTPAAAAAAAAAYTRHVEELGGTTSLMGLMLFFNSVDHLNI